MIQSVYSYFREITHLLVSMFVWPTKTFDELNGIDEKGYENLKEKIVEVILEVSSSKGKVRYSGSNWSAILADKSQENIKVGKRARIVNSQGNILLVSPLN